MDKTTVSGTVDTGSIPVGGTKNSLNILLSIEQVLERKIIDFYPLVISDTNHSSS